MPRGSRQGERRGGRQRGTPNKKTILKNAVFCAAAAQTNISPLHFMLGLMRDPNVPTDLRIEMAVAAAPFVHARRQATRGIRTNPLDSSPINSSPDISAPKMDGELSAPERPVDGKDDLSPLNFLLSVMKDADATPKQRIKAAKIAARYQHAPVLPDKTDEYGFTISRTLAKAIKDDWLALQALGVSSKAAPRRAEIRARQAQRDELLHCPPGYSPDRDMKRRDELLKMRRRSMAEETELAFTIARITASEAALNRSSQGQIRRMEDLEYRRQTANRERNRQAGLTRAEGKELDELHGKYGRRNLRLPKESHISDLASLVAAFTMAPGRPAAAAEGSLTAAKGPDLSEMEELRPTITEMLDQYAARREETIARRRAAGDPDPWGGEFPRARIHDLEERRYLTNDLTPAEEDERQQIARLHPEEVENIRKMVERQLYRQKFAPQ